MPPVQTSGSGAAPQQEDGDLQFFGVDLRDPRTLRPGLLNDARNLRCDNLVPETRRGVEKPAWCNRVDAATSTKINPWGVIYGGGVYKDPATLVEWRIRAADGLIYRSTPFNQTVSIALPSGVSIVTPVSFVQAFNNLYCFRGQYLRPLKLADFDTGFVDVLAPWSSAGAYTVGTEVGYGPYQAVTSITRVASTAKVVTTVAHGFITGADITHFGAGQTEYNVRATITVIDDVTYTFPVAGTPATPATGTIKCSNTQYWYKALGSQIALSAGELTSSGTTATVHHVAHGFTTAQLVKVTGAVQTEYNVTSAAITVTDADHFTFPFAGSGTTPATGTIIVTNKSVVLAGQSPDTNAEAWQRIYNILPNADNALYINNRLLVPTAFEPSSADNYATFSGGSYKKKDYIVATDYLDDVHFDFADEFRINQGSADEIVDLAKFNENTVVVWKGNSWGVLSNVALDLSQLTLDFRSNAYGLAARWAWASAGEDLLFMAPKRGVVSIRQTEQGKLLSIDLPLSAPVQRWIERINWSAGEGIRLESWNSKLYVAVPLDGSATNNTLLIYDFVLAARARGNTTYNVSLDAPGWVGRDTGDAITPAEFYKMQVAKVERLLFAAADGYENMVEACDAGDEIASADTDSGLQLAAIDTYALTRAYEPTADRLARPDASAVILQTLNPSYTLNLIFQGVNKKTVLVANKTRSATNYFRPWDATPWDPSNQNDDFKTPDREDYSLRSGPHLIDGLEFSEGQCDGLGILTVGERYQFEVSETAGFPISLEILSGTTPVGFPFSHQPGEVYAFVSNGDGVRLNNFGLGDGPVPATLSRGLACGSGINAALFQEAINKFRPAGRQGRSFQIELQNSQGRVKLLAVALGTAAGRERKGILA